MHEPPHSALKFVILEFTNHARPLRRRCFTELALDSVSAEETGKPTPNFIGAGGLRIRIHAQSLVKFCHARPRLEVLAALRFQLWAAHATGAGMTCRVRGMYWLA